MMTRQPKADQAMERREQVNEELLAEVSALAGQVQTQLERLVSFLDPNEERSNGG